jgi:hypothetical protein
MDMLAAATLALLLAAGGLREAQIPLPPEVARETDILELRGIGGGTRGSFTLGSSTGRFTRSADRTGLPDPLIVSHRGRSTFTIASAPAAGELAGRCAFGETQVNIGNFATTPRPLVYSCRFSRDGDPIAAELILRETKESLGSLLSKRERRGSLFLESARIEFRSLHRDRRGGLPMAVPIGYAFFAEGRQIGAIELNGSRKRIHAPQAARHREAVIAASVALSLLWDPAETAEP